MTFNEKYPDAVLRALSWKQPFASLMLKGKVETRVWDTKYRGWVLICASAMSYSLNELYELCGKDYEQYQRLLSAKLKPHMVGSAIAIGRLVDTRPMMLSDEHKCFVAFKNGLYCHFYIDVQPIEPIEWKGSQGWRTVTEKQKDLIIFK